MSTLAACAARHDTQPISLGTQPSRLAIFDPRVSDLSTLLAGVQPTVQTFVLDDTQNGIEQISEIQKCSAAAELTIIARGFCGGLHLGATSLTHRNLSDYEHHLRNWFSGQTSALLTLLASDVAQRATGKAFIQQLTAITGATVRASAQPIGQGHWLTATANTFHPRVLNTYHATL